MTAAPRSRTSGPACASSSSGAPLSTAMLLRVTAPSFVAGLELGRRAAPVIAYMTDWTLEEVRAYAKGRGWTVEVLEPARLRVRWPS